MTRWLFIALITGTAALGVLPTATANAIVPLPPPINRPAPPPGWAYRWVPPTYSTVLRRVWVEGSTQWSPDWVWINGRYEQVWRRITTPGHWEERTDRVEVRPGYWQLVLIEPPPRPFPRPWQTGAPTVGVDGYSSGPGEDLSKFSPLHEWPSK